MKGSTKGENFHVFTRFEAPQSNLPEVLNANWKQSHIMGVLKCCYFGVLFAINQDNIRDDSYNGE